MDKHNSVQKLSRKPNVLLILNDDMGYSDLGCYGGEIETPNLNRLAEDGLRFTQFYNTARCSPSRASLLTGLHPHQTGIGVLVDDDGPEGYPGNLNKHCVTIAEVLQGHNYRTYMSGKWHIAHNVTESNDTWPRQRGFDRFYGTLAGSGNYYYPWTLTRDNDNIEHEACQSDFYYTDAISENAIQCIRDHADNYPDTPFFQYVAYTAPHWPLHAREQDIAKYKGRFDQGWDQLRKERLERMSAMGMIDPSWELSERDPSQPIWEEVEHQEWELRRMEVYAAQIDRMDQGIGSIIHALEETGQMDNTLIIFLADNGGCAEELMPTPADKLVKNRGRTKSGGAVAYGNRPDVMPGSEMTFQSYGIGWANVSNTPFRLYKHWVHEGGISTPFIVHWPQGFKAKGELRHTACQLTDVMATILEITGANYPQLYKGNYIFPLEGKNITSLFNADSTDQRVLCWEHEGNAAIRIANWKLVRKYPDSWELFDMNQDRTEVHDLSSQFPEMVKVMSSMYEAWAVRCGIKPRKRILELMEERKNKTSGVVT